MKGIKILATALFILLLCGKLPHELSHASFARQGLSFYYRVQKLGVTILKASLSIQREEHFYLVQAAVDTTGVTLPFFRMHNRFRSYVKKEGLEPWRYVKEVNQWGIFSRRKYYTDILTFDLSNSKVIVERMDPPKVREVSVPSQTYDPLAIFLKYFLATDADEQDKIEMRIYDGTKVREVTFIATLGEIATPLYGEVRTVCVESTVPFSSLGNKEGVIKIWYTDDESRFPVDICLELPTVGSVEFQLERVEVW